MCIWHRVILLHRLRKGRKEAKLHLNVYLDFNFFKASVWEEERREGRDKNAVGYVGVETFNLLLDDIVARKKNLEGIQKYTLNKGQSKGKKKTEKSIICLRIKRTKGNIGQFCKWNVIKETRAGVKGDWDGTRMGWSKLQVEREEWLKK